ILKFKKLGRSIRRHFNQIFQTHPDFGYSCENFQTYLSIMRGYLVVYSLLVIVCMESILAVPVLNTGGGVVHLLRRARSPDPRIGANSHRGILGYHHNPYGHGGHHNAHHESYQYYGLGNYYAGDYYNAGNEQQSGYDSLGFDDNGYGDEYYRPGGYGSGYIYPGYSSGDSW
ncbi:hypothetical protein WDU94_015140, partial [Cyamophila willieti]